MRRLWIAFGLVIFLSFLELSWMGMRIHQAAPPIAHKVVTTDGQIVVDSGVIQAEQNVWQTPGWYGSGIDLGTWQLRRT